MESKKINQLATELAPELSDLTIIGDPTTGISKKITLSQMASLFTGTVEEYANIASFPLVGTADTIYIALDTNVIYRWNTGTSAYVELSPNIVTSLVFSDANGFDGTISLVGSTATLTITTALTTGSVPFIGASGALSQDNANLFFDDTNNRLGVNTNVPTTAIDVFGSGIIGRLNGTSTNNSFLGFASAGTNKWSIGNVQSDHRFRIYSEANTSELVSVLQTGEFGIGIANPTTKLHIDGGASALIANLDANVSVAKSISFRSDNSNRINLEVSGTESGSNAGANFFIRRYSDAGALIDTPLTITRSTGAITLTTALSGTSATFSGTLGIGTATSPAAELQVGKSSDVTIALSNSNSVTSGNRGSIAWYNSSVSTVANIKATAVTDNVGTQLEFYTRPAAGSLTQVMTLASTGAATFNLGSGEMRLNRTGTSEYLKANTYYLLTNGNDQYLGSETAGVNIYAGGSPRLNITSGGNVGIGVTPNDWRADIGNVRALQFDAGSIWGFRTSGTGELNIGQNYYYGASGTRYRLQTGEVSNYRQGDGTHLWQYAASGTAGTSFNFTEAMRITSGGYVKAANDGSYLNSTGTYHEFSNNTLATAAMVIRNTAGNFTDNVLAVGSSKGSNTNFNQIAAYTSDFTNIVFKVRGDGNVYNVNGVYTSGVSDIKYKEQIIDANSQWEDIKNLRVVNFKFIKDVEENGENALKHIGFIAQEVEKVSPNLIEEMTNNETNETWKTIKTSIIHTKAIKALQEAMLKIEALETEVQLLKAK